MLRRVRRTWRATDLVFFLDLHSMYMFATIKSDTKRNSAKLVCISFFVFCFGVLFLVRMVVWIWREFGVDLA